MKKNTNKIITLSKDFKKIKLIFILVLLIVVWSVVWPLFRFVVQEVPPLVFRVSAGIPAAILLLFIAKVTSQKLIIPKNKWVPLFFISFFNVTLWQVLMLYGVSMLGGGRAAVLGYTMPVWAVMVASIMGFERITFSSFLALCLGVFGVISLTVGIDFFSNWIGVLVMLMAGLSWGIGTMILKYGGLNFNAFVIAGWQQLIGILPIIPFAILWDFNNIGNPDYRHFLVLLFAIFFSSAYTYWAYFVVLQNFTVTVTSISVMMVPVLALLIDAMYLGIKFSYYDLIALLMIVMSIFIAATKPFNKKNK
jgi:drug/metabolite transporter (DMT)-like permease